MDENRALAAITFDDLANSSEFYGFFNMLWALAGIVTGLADPDGREDREPLSPELMAPVCRLIRSTPAGREACRLDGLRHAAQAIDRQGPECYVCHAGLMDFVMPIFVEGHHVATIEGGQVLVEPPGQAGYAEIARRTAGFGVDSEALREAYFGSSHISREKLLAAVELARLFAQHFSEVAWRLRRAEEPAVRPEITQAMEYVGRHYHEQISLGEVAREVHLSPAYFSSVFSEGAGMTFTAFVQRTRIERAKRLLRETDETITDIAFGIGFNNLTHFNYVFRKLEASAPSAYRKAVRSGDDAAG